jgi:hypothetical protein
MEGRKEKKAEEEAMKGQGGALEGTGRRGRRMRNEGGGRKERWGQEREPGSKWR